MRRSAKKILLILVSITIAVTSCLSISAVSSSVTANYVLTENMTNKTDTVQANYQTADTSSSRYTTELTYLVFDIDCHHELLICCGSR